MSIKAKCRPCLIVHIHANWPLTHTVIIIIIGHGWTPRLDLLKPNALGASAANRALLRRGKSFSKLNYINNCQNMNWHQFWFISQLSVLLLPLQLRCPTVSGHTQMSSPFLKPTPHLAVATPAIPPGRGTPAWSSRDRSDLTTQPSAFPSPKPSMWPIDEQSFVRSARDCNYY